MATVPLPSFPSLSLLHWIIQPQLALHIPDGFLSLPVSPISWILAIGLIALCLNRVNSEYQERAVPLMGVCAAFIFAAQMINFPIPGGTSGHLLGGTLAGVLLGPWAGSLVVSVVFIVQAVMFQDGGITVLGANITNMGLIGTFGGYYLYRTIRYALGRSIWRGIGIGIGFWILRNIPVAVGLLGFDVWQPMQAVRQGVKALLSDLKTDPQALETAYLSVITFESTARQVSPLTEIIAFQEPNLVAGGGTSMGAALKLLEQCIDKEIQKASETQKGDWKPLVFIMTDGGPTDTWESAADRIKQKKPANIIACAAGSGADESVLKRITEIVVKLDNLQPDTLKAFFRWVTDSIKQTSQSVAQVMADNAPITLPPPPAQITIIP